MRKRSVCSLGAALVVLALAHSSSAVVTLQPGLRVETYATYTAPQMPYGPRDLMFDGSGNMYLTHMADGAIYKVAPDKTVTRWVDGQYALRKPELGLSNWEGGRLLGRGGILSGDSVHTIRYRAIVDDHDTGR